MIHLRIVTPADKTEPALELLEESASVCNIVLLEGAARRPAGDVILADVAREDASVIIADLKELRIHAEGAISIEPIDSQISEPGERAVEHAKGAPADAVIWEEVEARTNESVELSGVYLAFMVIAALLAAVGIYQDSPILIVGAMVVGPEFGPLAGLCVALVQRQPRLALRSALALVVGFPLAIAAVYVAVLLFKATGLFAGDVLGGRSQPGQHHLPAGLLRLLRGRLRGRGRHAEPEHRQVGRADRGPDLGHDDPGGRERRPLGGVPGLGELARQPRPAGDQPRLDRRRRLARAPRAARALPAAQAPAHARGAYDPSDDQISTFVLIFSITASVNSVVVAWPPRSSVLIPAAVVSSVLS